MVECDFAEGLDHRGLLSMIALLFRQTVRSSGTAAPMNRGHTDDEVPVSGLVMEQIHSGNGADTAADYGREKECAFRNTPMMADSALFIRIHQDKRCQIYNDKVNHP